MHKPRKQCIAFLGNKCYNGTNNVVRKCANAHIRINVSEKIQGGNYEKCRWSKGIQNLRTFRLE